MLYEIALQSNNVEDVMTQCSVNQSFSKRCNEGFWEKWYKKYIGDSKKLEDESWKMNSIIAKTDFKDNNIAIIFINKYEPTIMNKIYTKRVDLLTDLNKLHYSYIEDRIKVLNIAPNVPDAYYYTISNLGSQFDNRYTAKYIHLGNLSKTFFYYTRDYGVARFGYMYYSEAANYPIPNIDNVKQMFKKNKFYFDVESDDFPVEVPLPEFN